METYYTTNTIGNRFLIAKGYKTFQVKQGVSRVELVNEMGKCRTTNMTSRNYSKEMCT